MSKDVRKALMIAKGPVSSGYLPPGNPDITKAEGGGVDGFTDELPPEPGTQSIPEGHIRLYHQTDEANISNILENGISKKHAKGFEGPKAIYADPKGFYGEPGKVPSVEFSVPKEDWKPPFVLRDEIKPSEIIAHHVPWHDRARYILDNPQTKDAVLAGKYDHLEGDYKKAVSYVKSTSGKIAKAEGGEVDVQYDNPGGNWLKHQRENAEATVQKRGNIGASGALTAWSKPVHVDPAKLSKIPGSMNERPEPGNAKYDALHKSMSAEGYSNKSPLLVGINHRGEPHIIEGNHRAAVARDLGVKSIPAEFRWFAGGEQADGFKPEHIKSLMPDIDKAEGGAVDDPSDPDYHAKVHQDLMWHSAHNRSSNYGAALYHHLMKQPDQAQITKFYEETVYPIFKKHGFPKPPEGPASQGNPKYQQAVSDVVKNWRDVPRNEEDITKAEGGAVEETVPEAPHTLESQLQAFLQGKRKAVLYTHEEPAPPEGAQRLETAHGVFHYNPALIDERSIKAAVAGDRINEILGYGPYSKKDVLNRVTAGDTPLAVVGRDAEGREVVAAAGTHGTANEQASAIAAQLPTGGQVHIESPQQVISERIAALRSPEQGNKDARKALMIARAMGGRIGKADGGGLDEEAPMPAPVTSGPKTVFAYGGKQYEFAVTPPDKQITSKDLAAQTTDALQQHLSLPYMQQVANSKAAANKLAPYVGRDKKGAVKPFLTMNAKLEKASAGYEAGPRYDAQAPLQLEGGIGVETIGMPLAPSYEHNKFKVCPNSAVCKDECLGVTSGNYAQADWWPRQNSKNRTQAFLSEPGALAVQLHGEIQNAKQAAAMRGNRLAVRLNVLSDIDPRVHEALIKANPDVDFYDYTKMNYDPIAPNHHYTYSSTGLSQPGGGNSSVNGLTEGVENKHQNWKQMRNRLDTGSNVAMVFSHKEHLPREVYDRETDRTYRVVDGTTHDYRPLDKQAEGSNGVIIGLQNLNQTGKQDNAYKTSNGFVVHYDPQVQMVPNVKTGLPTKTPVKGPSPGLNKKGSSLPRPTFPTNYRVEIAPQGGEGRADGGAVNHGQQKIHPDYAAQQFHNYHMFNGPESAPLAKGERPTQYAYGGPVEGDRELDNSGFYNAAAEAAQGIPQAKGTPQQMMSMVQKAPGTQEAMKWSGADQAFAGQPIVSKEDLVKHFQTNAPKLEETQLGGKGGITENKEKIAAWIEKSAAERAVQSGEIETEKDFGTADPDIRKWHLRESENNFYIKANDRDFIEQFHTYGKGEPTKYHKYTIPGGENYREILLKAPPNKSPERDRMSAIENRRADIQKELMKLNDDELYRHLSTEGTANVEDFTKEKIRLLSETENLKNEYKSLVPKTQNIDYNSSHWEGHPNVVAHLRMSDRTLPQTNEKALHLEELQSDWGQAGRAGFKKSPEELASMKADMLAAHKNYLDLNNHGSGATLDKILAAEDKYHAVMNEWGTASRATTPEGPYVGNTAKWTELGLKRALVEAARGGHDKLIWTPGDDQADRYDLSQHINELAHWRDGDQIGLSASGPEGTVFDQHYVSEKELPNVVGKELAQKILNGEGAKKSTAGYPSTPDVRFISGTGLKVGGEGMKGYYDKIVPTALARIVKSIGHTPEFGTDYIQGRKDDRDLVLINRRGQYHVEIEEKHDNGWRYQEEEHVAGPFATREEADAHRTTLSRGLKAVPSLKITPAMRETISKGLPRKTGGFVPPARSGDRQLGLPVSQNDASKALMIARAMGGRIAKAGGGELPLVGPTPAMATDLPSLRSQVPLETTVATDDSQENTRYWGNIATPPSSSQNVLSAEAVAPVYTSRVHELLTNPSALNRMKMGRPQQWVKSLQRGGAKPEEIGMYGIGEGDPNTKISRDEVHARLDGKIPQLREKLLGGGGNKDALEVDYGDWETEEPDYQWLYDNAVSRRQDDIEENKHDNNFMEPYAEEAVYSYSKKHLTSPNTVGPVNIEGFVHHALEGELLSKDTAQGILDAAKNKAITPEQWSDAVDEMNKNQVAKIEKEREKGSRSNGDLSDHTKHYEKAVHALHGASNAQISKHFKDAAMDDREALEILTQQEREYYYEDRDSPQTRTASVTNPTGRDLDYEVRHTGYDDGFYVTDRHGRHIGNAGSDGEAEELIRSHAAKQLGMSGKSDGQKNIDKPNVHDVGIHGEGSQHSLPGVTDYREHTLHFDPATDREFREGHYDPNAVVHMRYGTVNDDKGKRLLYLDELQSDWHQKGMSRGYDTPEGREAQKTAQVRYAAAEKELEGHRTHIASGLGFESAFAVSGLGVGADEYAAMMVMTPEDADAHNYTIFRKYNGLMSRHPHLANAMFGENADDRTAPELVKNFQDYSKSAFGDDYKQHATALSSALEKANNLREAVRGNLLPDAPWKNTSEWSKLAMKRALRIAADYGYDGVALSPGWVQKQRWGNDDHEKLYDDLIGGSMKSLAKQEGLNFGTASIPLLSTHARNKGINNVQYSRSGSGEVTSRDTSDQAHAIYLEDKHRDKIRKQGFKLFKQGGYVPMKNNSAVEQALKLTSKSGATLPAAVSIARQHQRRD